MEGRRSSGRQIGAWRELTCWWRDVRAGLGRWRPSSRRSRIRTGWGDGSLDISCGTTAQASFGMGLPVTSRPGWRRRSGSQRIRLRGRNRRDDDIHDLRLRARGFTRGGRRT